MKNDNGNELARRFYRVRQITAITGLSRGHVYQALNSGQLKGLKLDKVLLIPAESFEAWLKTAVPYRQPSSVRGGRA